MNKSRSLWHGPNSLIGSDLKTDFRRWKVIETNSNFCAVQLWVKACYPRNKRAAWHPKHAKFIGSACLSSKRHGPGLRVVQNTENRASDHRDGNASDMHHAAPNSFSQSYRGIQYHPTGSPPMKLKSSK